jgi:hypothetical protein
MSGFDDDWAEMTGTASTGNADSGGAGAPPPGAAAVTMFLSDLKALGEDPAPEPSPQLAALLGGAVPLAPERRRVRARHLALGAAAALLVAGTGGAAAAGRLPGPAQRMVSDVVDNLTPFSIPRGGAPASPSGVPSGRQGPAAPVVPAPAIRSVEPGDSSEPAEPSDRSEPSEDSAPGAPTGRAEPSDGAQPAGAGEAGDGREPGDGGAARPAQPGAVPRSSSGEQEGWSGGGASAGSGGRADGSGARGTSAPGEYQGGGTGGPGDG